MSERFIEFGNLYANLCKMKKKRLTNKKPSSRIKISKIKKSSFR